MPSCKQFKPSMWDEGCLNSTHYALPQRWGGAETCVTIQRHRFTIDQDLPNTWAEASRRLQLQGQGYTERLCLKENEICR